MRIVRKLTAAAAIISIGTYSTGAFSVGVNPAPETDANAAGEHVGSTPNQQMHVPVEGDTDWPSFNRGLDSVRYSELDQINADNVGDLEEACRVRVSGAGPFARPRYAVLIRRPLCNA